LAYNVYGLNLISRYSSGGGSGALPGSQTQANPALMYFMYNGHKDVTALLGNAGGGTGTPNAVVATYYYDAFGNIDDQTGTQDGSGNSYDPDNPYRYAGYVYDSSSGLYYVNSRFFDPSIARFMQEDTHTGDPNDPLSLNLYTYCVNNPLIYSDPTGHVVMSDPGPSVIYVNGGSDFVIGINANYKVVNVGANSTVTNQGIVGTANVGGGSTYNNYGTTSTANVSGGSTYNNYGSKNNTGYTGTINVSGNSP